MPREQEQQQQELKGTQWVVAVCRVSRLRPRVLAGPGSPPPQYQPLDEKGCLNELREGAEDLEEDQLRLDLHTPKIELN